MLSATHKQQLNEKIGRSGDWKLLYRATRDGFDQSKFHELCDSKGPTVTVARVSDSGRLVGGFTSVAWGSEGFYKKDTIAFLFNGGGDGLVIFHIKKGEEDKAVWHGKNFGPDFGVNDLRLLWSSHPKRAYSKGGQYAFEDYELTGADYLSIAVDEIEVFAV